MMEDTLPSHSETIPDPSAPYDAPSETPATGPTGDTMNPVDDPSIAQTIPENDLRNIIDFSGIDPVFMDDPYANVALTKSRVTAATRLRSTFQHIYDKYGHDFSGVGDEIDLLTGKIIVNNGHLQEMKNERDLGPGYEYEKEDDPNEQSDDDLEEVEEEGEEAAAATPSSSTTTGNLVENKNCVLEQPPSLRDRLYDPTTPGLPSDDNDTILPIFQPKLINNRYVLPICRGIDSLWALHRKRGPKPKPKPISTEPPPPKRPRGRPRKIRPEEGEGTASKPATKSEEKLKTEKEKEKHSGIKEEEEENIIEEGDKATKEEGADDREDEEEEEEEEEEGDKEERDEGEYDFQEDPKESESSMDIVSLKQEDSRSADPRAEASEARTFSPLSSSTGGTPSRIPTLLDHSSVSSVPCVRKRSSLHNRSKWTLSPRKRSRGISVSPRKRRALARYTDASTVTSGGVVTLTQNDRDMNTEDSNTQENLTEPNQTPATVGNSNSSRSTDAHGDTPSTTLRQPNSLAMATVTVIERKRKRVAPPVQVNETPVVGSSSGNTHTTGNLTSSSDVPLPPVSTTTMQETNRDTIITDFEFSPMPRRPEPHPSLPSTETRLPTLTPNKIKSMYKYPDPFEVYNSYQYPELDRPPDPTKNLPTTDPAAPPSSQPSDGAEFENLGLDMSLDPQLFQRPEMQPSVATTSEQNDVMHLDSEEAPIDFNLGTLDNKEDTSNIAPQLLEQSEEDIARAVEKQFEEYRASGALDFMNFGPAPSAETDISALAFFDPSLDFGTSFPDTNFGVNVPHPEDPSQTPNIMSCADTIKEEANPDEANHTTLPDDILKQATPLEDGRDEMSHEVDALLPSTGQVDEIDKSIEGVQSTEVRHETTEAVFPVSVHEMGPTVAANDRTTANGDAETHVPIPNNAFTSEQPASEVDDLPPIKMEDVPLTTGVVPSLIALSGPSVRASPKPKLEDDEPLVPNVIPSIEDHVAEFTPVLPTYLTTETSPGTDSSSHYAADDEIAASSSVSSPTIPFDTPQQASCLLSDDAPAMAIEREVDILAESIPRNDLVDITPADDPINECTNDVLPTEADREPFRLGPKSTKPRKALPHSPLQERKETNQLPPLFPSPVESTRHQPSPPLRSVSLLSPDAREPPEVYVQRQVSPSPPVQKQALHPHHVSDHTSTSTSRSSPTHKAVSNLKQSSASTLRRRSLMSLLPSNLSDSDDEDELSLLSVSPPARSRAPTADTLSSARSATNVPVSTKHRVEKSKRQVREEPGRQRSSPLLPPASHYANSTSPSLLASTVSSSPSSEPSHSLPSSHFVRASSRSSSFSSRGHVTTIDREKDLEGAPSLSGSCERNEGKKSSATPSTGSSSKGESREHRRKEQRGLKQGRSREQERTKKGSGSKEERRCGEPGFRCDREFCFTCIL